MLTTGGSSERLIIDGFGKATINAPSSGVALTVTSVSTSTAIAMGDGAVATPGLSFIGDTNSGIYRIGADNIGVGVNGAKVLDISTTGLGVTGTMVASGAISGSNLSSSGGANPSASLGLTAVNGSAITYMRSDAAPALDVGISPTWSGTHTFNNTPVVPAASWAYAKIQNVSATSRVLGRITAGAGTIEELTGANLATIIGTSLGANPSASVGLTAVNGTAGTYMRSDAAPALSVSISPTWTGNHTFTPPLGTTAIIINSSLDKCLSIVGTASGTNPYFSMTTNGGTQEWNWQLLSTGYLRLLDRTGVFEVIGFPTNHTTIFGGAAVLANYTVAGLPSAATVGAYATAFVSDATLGIAAGLGLAPVGGGSNKVPVYSDGAAWKIG